MNISQAELVARFLMEEHGLTARGWRFQWDNAVRRFGCCMQPPRKLITMSRSLTEANSVRHMVDVILHEIAHALVPVGSGHGPTWRQKALSIGCNGKRCYGAEVNVARAQFLGTCPACGHTTHNHRRNKTACSACCRKHNNGKWDSRFMFAWTRVAE
jgi:predicted SprT family Zn-dependent metalloprotease